MNVLLVHAHHEPRSFCSAMKDVIIKQLERSGHCVEVTDLYSQGFDPVSDRRNFRTTADPNFLRQQDEEAFATRQGGFVEELAAEMDKILRADLLVFNFPLWWFGLPAILKGWVDRVFAYGKMYGGGRLFENGSGGGKQCLLTLTTGGPAGAYAGGGINPPMEAVLRPIHQGIFWFLGYQPLTPFVAFAPRTSSPEERLATLSALERHIAGVDALPRLAFPRLGDFTAFGAPDSFSRFMVELRRGPGAGEEFQPVAELAREQLRILELEGKVLFSSTSTDDWREWIGWLIIRAKDEDAAASLLRALPLHPLVTTTIRVSAATPSALFPGPATVTSPTLRNRH
jgi:NAD(P)H dehydrogenase (quinone)